ncbi:phosphotyrosine-binding domain-containing protein [Ditylenchus destructor]|nr:phosphotyrosine-binding domain-containing protein [Ditylenchus destructor]
MRNGFNSRQSNGVHYAPPPSQSTSSLNPRQPPPYEGTSSNGYTSSSRLPSHSNPTLQTPNGRGYYYSSGTPAAGGSNTSGPPSSSPSTGGAASTASPSSGAPRTEHFRTTTTTLTSANGNNDRMADQPPYGGGPPRRTNTLPSGGRRGNFDVETSPPSYQVEHLATFAVGRQFGLQTPSDGIRKLKQMEKKSAIWAQPMVLKLFPDRVCVEDENGDLVEQFPMDLVIDPTAHVSSDPVDMYNNVLLFIVKEDIRSGARNVGPTEIHIFQCAKTPAQEVAEDLHHYIKGSYHKVRPGYRDANFGPPPANMTSGPPPRGAQYRDDISVTSTEYFEMDVNTLNRCFDDIERFVARIQSAAIAQRELEMQQHRMRQHRSSSKRKEAQAAAQRGILQLRAQIPTYNEFFEVFQKFKLSFNLLAKLKNHIHEPNAPELLHFLFTPLTVILDACHWGLGMNVAEQVLNPLLSLDACELLRNCLTSKECDVWMALGRAWRTPPEDWLGTLPPPYRPVFSDGFAPYGLPNGEAAPRYSSAPAPIHRGVSAPVSQPSHYGAPPPRSAMPPYRERSVDNLNLDRINMDRINLEKERLEFERMKVLDREQQLLEHEKRLRQEEARLDAERRMLHKEAEKHSIAGSDRPDFYRRDANSAHQSPRLDRRTGSVQVLSNGHVTSSSPNYSSPRTGNVVVSPPIVVPDQSPRQKAFLDDLVQRRCKIVQVTYDRVMQNPKELTVARGEYLEVLNDQKNWWECRNVHSRLGYVPHTILSVLALENADTRSIQEQTFMSPGQDRPQASGGGPHSPRNGSVYVSNVSVQTRAQTSEVPHIGGLVDGIQSIKLRPIQHRLTIGQSDFINSKLIQIQREEHKYVPEMVDTIKRNRQVIGTRRIASFKGNIINENSNKEQLQAWLRDKGFSDFVQSVFSECEAIDLFQLSKDEIRKYCGEEGNRLYSLLLVQKRRSNFSTGTEAQLKALLEMRKKHVDAKNEGEIEPDLPAPSQPKRQKMSQTTTVSKPRASSSAAQTQTQVNTPIPNPRTVKQHEQKRSPEPSSEEAPFFAQPIRSYH